MFDANARYLPKGTKFIAGDALLVCEMMSNSSERPVVRVYYGLGKWYIYDYDKPNYEWLPYQGQWDGTGFISEVVRINSVMKVAAMFGKPWPAGLNNPLEEK